MSIGVTGGAGFLGKYIVQQLSENFQVQSIGRSQANDIVVDLTCEVPHFNEVPQYVVHAAGKAHIYPKTAAEKQAFFDVNVKGTANLLKALSAHVPKRFVFISTVAVYGLEQGTLIDEATPLLGTSPYAQSKIQAEALIQAWCREHQIPFLILRLPLVVGKNAPGNLGKMIKAIEKGRYVRIAKGDARKSAVLAADVAALVQQWLQQAEPRSGIYHVTDGYHPSFYEIEERIRTHFQRTLIPTIPSWLGRLLGRIGDIIPGSPFTSQTLAKITHTFTFSDANARNEIGWTSKSVLENLL
ncbi:MAG TPA: NAD-dependent epimerase/dehydratase family protein [Chitinophagaceae bacterium]|jgi:nucleoside-diphosphate-sugar epimerase|nr:NAD-dependent epimerase/dehydratase family protein [Chitinophagaceae bacterium]